MARCRSLIWIDAHEQLASLHEAKKVLSVMGDKFLNGIRVAKISEIAEDGHEPLGFERETVHIEGNTG